MRLAEFSKVADILAREHKIHVKSGSSWASNIQSREVFYVKNDIYNLSEDHILGLLLHEIAHIHYTSDVKLPTKNKELTHSALNMVEDISIEHIISQDYPNAGEILESTNKELLDTLVGMLPKMKTPIHEKALLYGAIRFYGRGYAFGSEPHELIGEEVAKLMKQNEVLIYSRKSTGDLLPLVEEIVRLLIKQAGQPTPEELTQMQDEMHGHAHQTDEQGHAKGKVIGKLKGGRGWKEGSLLSPKIQFVDAIADQAAMIGKKLRTVLKRNNAMEFGGRYRTGKLQARRMVRVKALKDRRPFARRIIKSNQSYAFAVACDVSGSMFGCGGDIPPGDYALSSMHMVGEALRAAGVPRAMLVFGREARVAAPMGKAAIRWDQLNDENLIKRARPGGTEIDKAIKAGAAELGKTRAERKILIVLTDGQSDLPEMQRAHKAATDAGVECLGITIGGHAGCHMDETFRKNNRNLPDTRDSGEIGKAFIEILQSSITTSP